LEDGLEVHRMLERLVHLLGEGVDNGGRDAVEAEGEVGGADDRLADRGEDAVGLDQHLRALAGALRRLGAEALGHVEVASDLRAGLAGHRLGAQLGEPPSAVAGEARIEVVRDREAQHHVTEEREPLIGVPPLIHPARMRECLASKVGRKLVE